jgi:hypothetical protein
MKTLDQVEPRTPITNLPFVITSSGSYYATTNLNGASGILIDADDVTIDLNGFTLDGFISGASDGIAVTGFHENIRIENGTLLNWQRSGIELDSSRLNTIRNVTVRRNANHGISGGEFAHIQNCRAEFNSANGIEVNFDGVVEDSISDNNATGINTLGRSIVHHCRIAANHERHHD